MGSWVLINETWYKSNKSAVKNVSERDLGEAGRQEGASKDQQQGTQ